MDLIIIFLVGFDNCEQRISVWKDKQRLNKLPSCLSYRASLGDPSDLKSSSQNKSKRKWIGQIEAGNSFWLCSKQ